MQKNGAGFAGFATWLDMTPADADMFGLPDSEQLIQLPWKPEVGWLPRAQVGLPLPRGRRPGLAELWAAAAVLVRAQRRRLPALVASESPTLMLTGSGSSRVRCSQRPSRRAARAGSGSARWNC